MYSGYRTAIAVSVGLLISLAILVLFGMLLWYVFRALRKYLRETPGRAEDAVRRFQPPRTPACGGRA